MFGHMLEKIRVCQLQTTFFFLISFFIIKLRLDGFLNAFYNVSYTSDNNSFLSKS